jgi:general secretion pathway protein C
MSLSANLRDFQSQSDQQLLDRATRTLPQALYVFLVIAIAWQLVQLTWMLLEPAPSAELEPLAASTTPPARPKGVDVQAIINAKLFGTAESSEPAQGPAPETQLPLVLSGVFAAEDPEKGWALIGDSAQQSKVFSVGDSVRSGARLHSVYPDRVILDRNGTLETLALPKRNTGTLSVSRPPPPPETNRLADNLRQLAQTNPTVFAEIVRPQPVFANGVQRGYRVYPGRNRQQFAKLGLQPGDLVLAINGTPLDDPQRGMEIFNTIGSSDRVQVTVERNGESQDLTLNTAQISLPDPNAAPAPPRGRPGANRSPSFTPTPPEE